MPDLETSLGYCTFCPNLCRHRCPVSNAEPRETLIPRAKMANLRRLRHRELEPTVENTASLYACTGCGACTEACLHRVEPAAALFGGRAAAQRRGAGHPALADLPARVQAHAERAAREVRAAFARARGEAAGGGPDRRLRAMHFRDEAQVALLPSCEDPAGAVQAMAVFSRLGAGYVVVADVTFGCGGYPLLAGGYPDAFRAHAETVARQLQGYARLIVACPTCAHVMKHEYPARGIALRPEVLHVAEFLAGLAPAINVTHRLPAAYYHDPCYLGRREGMYDGPRRVLERVLVEVREFSRRREDADCCGGGGLVPLTMPETAEAMAALRVAEPAASDAPRIVTACPTCAQRLTRDGVVARGLLEVVEEATRPARDARPAAG